MHSSHLALGSNVAAFEEGMNQLKTAAIIMIIAAILFLIAIFVSLLSPVAWILVIAGAGNAVSKVRQATQHKHSRQEHL